MGMTGKVIYKIDKQRLNCYFLFNFYEFTVSEIEILNSQQHMDC